MNIVQMRRASANTYGLSSEVIDYAMQYGAWNKLKNYVSTNIAIVPYVNQCPQLTHSLVKTDYVPFLDTGSVSSASIMTDLLIQSDCTFDVYFYFNVKENYHGYYGKRTSGNSADSFGAVISPANTAIDTYLPRVGKTVTGVISQGVVVHHIRTTQSVFAQNTITGASDTFTTTNAYQVGNNVLYIFNMGNGASTTGNLKGGVSRCLLTNGGISFILAPYYDGNEWGYLNTSSLQFYKKTLGDGAFSFVLKQRTILMTT